MPEKLSVSYDLAAPAEQRISRLYCWVAIGGDGSEGIASAGPVPLISSERRVAESLAGPALAVKRAGKAARVELRVYDLAEVVTKR